jgi:hypothetical protein
MDGIAIEDYQRGAVPFCLVLERMCWYGLGKLEYSWIFPILLILIFPDRTVIPVLL